MISPHNLPSLDKNWASLCIFGPYHSISLFYTVPVTYFANRRDIMIFQPTHSTQGLVAQFRGQIPSRVCSRYDFGCYCQRCLANLDFSCTPFFYISTMSYSRSRNQLLLRRCHDICHTSFSLSSVHSLRTSGILNRSANLLSKPRFFRY